MPPFCRIPCSNCRITLTFYLKDLLKGVELFKGKTFCFICGQCGRTLCTKENPFEQW